MNSEIKEEPVAGQTAIVTGAAQGIGRAIALRLGRDGYRVLAADLRAEAAQETADAIVAAGGEAWAEAIDVTAADHRKRLVARAVERGGGLHLLVNNAGVNRASDPLDVTEDHWDAVMSVNAKAVWFMCQEAMRYMVPRGEGRIVNIASIAGKEGNPTASAYSASKAAVIGLTKSLGKELAKTGIRVNCVTPAAVRTAIFDQITQAHIDFMLSKIPMGRFGTVEEIAAMVCWLASEECSFSTGAVFDLSGGRATY